MKKSIIIVILIGSMLGLLFGKLLFKNYDGKKYLNETGNIYYIQYGVYTSNDAAIKNASNLEKYKIIENDDKYYVYLGITSNYEVALKAQKLYKEKGIYTFIRSDYVKNSETLELIKKYDNSLNDTSNLNDIQEVFKELLNNSKILF